MGHFEEPGCCTTQGSDDDVGPVSRATLGSSDSQRMQRKTAPNIQSTAGLAKPNMTSHHQPTAPAAKPASHPHPHALSLQAVQSCQQLFRQSHYIMIWPGKRSGVLRLRTDLRHPVAEAGSRAGLRSRSFLAVLGGEAGASAAASSSFLSAGAAGASATAATAVGHHE